MAKITLTPETCRHLDTFCNECSVALLCEPVDSRLASKWHGGGIVETLSLEAPVLVVPDCIVPRAKYDQISKKIPDHLKSASPAVRKAHGY